MAKTQTHERKIFKLLVCGGRDFSDSPMLEKALTKTNEKYKITHLIHGDARGLDKMAGAWAQKNGIQPVIVPALWNYYGNSAGPIRNQYMADLSPDRCLSFPGGNGTRNMVEQCLRYNIPVTDAEKLVQGIQQVQDQDIEIGNRMAKRSIIDQFSGIYRFLSNFYPSVVTLNGKKYDTVEHAYQAAKSKSKVSRELIRKAETPGIAKKIGGSITIREDWPLIKIKAMEFLLKQKFKRGSELASLLLSTGEAKLVEGNTWYDVYWGVDLNTGRGENHLGRLLMKIRQELSENVGKEEEKPSAQVKRKRVKKNTSKGGKKVSTGKKK